MTIPPTLEVPLRRRRWLSIAAAVLLVGTVACSAAETPGPSATLLATANVTASPTAPASATSTPTPNPTVPASPTPTPVATVPPPAPADAVFDLLPVASPAGYVPQTTCVGEIGPSDPVAVVQLLAPRADVQGQIVLRDYADPAHPRTACTFGDWVEQLIDPRHVVVWACATPDGSSCAWALVELPEVRYRWFALPRVEDGWADFLAVAPSLDEVAWISSAGDGTNRRLHLTRADGDHVVAELLPVGGRCGSPDDSIPAAYTRSGAHLMLLDVPDYSTAVFLIFAGRQELLSLRPPAGGWSPTDAGRPIMPVWSPTNEALYFEQNGDIRRWTPDGGIATVLPGVSWYDPTISPDGRYLAYAATDADGTHATYLVDLHAGFSPRLIAHDRIMPVFLTDTQLWQRSEAAGTCGYGLNDRLIYDINEQSEAPSIIDNVLGVWPATSSILR